MQLEKQLKEMARIGLHLNPDITANHLLESFSRAQYEDKPFELLLFVFGIEIESPPWGRYFTRFAWNFDTECIHNERGSYTRILNHLNRLALPDRQLVQIDDHVDFIGEQGTLRYIVGDRQREWQLDVFNDFADTYTLSFAMADLAYEDHAFYSVDNGQAMVLYFITHQQARDVNELVPGALQKVG